MPIAGQLGAGDFMGAGSNFGSAFGPLPEREPSIQPFTGFNPTGSGIRTPNIQPLSPSSTMTSISNMLNQYGDKKWGGSPSNTQGGMGTGPISTIGGDWSGVEQWNSAIASAASRTGVDANLIKAVMKLESNGDPNAAGAAGVWGPMQVNSNAWGQGAWMSDPNANIMKGAEILKIYMDENGGDMYQALRHYHGIGSDGYTTDTQYADIVMGNYNSLRTLGGTGMGAGLSSGIGAGGKPAKINGQWGGDPQGQSIVDIAKHFVGTPYVWGAIPGLGQDPSGGWDCSGFTYWLDQNYGSQQLPMGSHYQYQYAQSTGKLFTDTNQLKVGDLIFFDTGDHSGGGGELNNASHVAMYIGNGQIIHAANPAQGTLISNMSDGYYSQRFMGAMHATWSGGGGGVPGMGPISSGGAPAAAPGSVQSLFNKFQGYGGGTTGATTPQQALFQKFQRGY